MDQYKELRVVLDLKTHSALKSVAAANKKSIKKVIIDLIEEYIDRGVAWENVINEGDNSKDLQVRRINKWIYRK